ncbi:MAG: hypothetical protein Fur0032_06240 [Terrimicrobiaceae bacterium]
MRAHSFAALLAASLSVGCQPSPQPADTPRALLTRQNIGSAFADYAILTADANKSGQLSKTEWLSVGGTSSGFDSLDTNSSGKLTRLEIRKGASTDKFWAMVSQTMDVGSNTPMTPKVFRNPASARLFAYQF